MHYLTYENFSIDKEHSYDLCTLSCVVLSRGRIECKICEIVWKNIVIEDSRNYRDST